MKSLKLLFALGLLTLFSGCEIVEELVAPEFDVTLAFDGSLRVESAQLGNPNDNVTLESEIGFYRIAEDPEIVDALNEGDEITGIKINSVRYSYSNFVGDAGTFIVGPGKIDLYGFMQEFRYDTPDADTVLSTADFNNESFTLLGDFSALEQNLLNSGLTGIGIRYRGTASNNPVDMDVVVFISVTVTIKPDF